jgi:hypothetical protein
MASRRTVSSQPKTDFDAVAGIPIGRIFLAPHNPRFDPVTSELQAIERLCSKEDILPLARDIVRNGLSPLERFALTQLPGTKDSPSYYVEEGNRRICALKLLMDPDRAPSSLRKSFEELADTWDAPINSVDATVFSNNDTLRTWLERTHSGLQGGIGRKNWTSEQKQRFSGTAKNELAQIILDYAENQGMLTKKEREESLLPLRDF